MADKKCTDWNEAVEVKCPYCGHVGIYYGVGYWQIDECDGCHKSFELGDRE